jgi:hypothetical protein
MLQEYIQNIASSDESVGIAERVIGDRASLFALADFYEQHSNTIKLLELHSEMMFTHQVEFDSKELKAFQNGLSSVGKLLLECVKEKKLITDSSKIS